MRRMILFSAMFLTLSCGLSEIGGRGVQDSVSGAIWGGPLQDSEESTVDQKCYVTAFDYQKGYDWRSDQSKESVKCSLVVYVDGKPVMKVPVGEKYEISADPDMHRILDGHLYTDYSTDSETVIKKDGMPLFRYSGRESVIGMTVINDSVYHLGQNRSGDGFNLRKNGEIIFSRQTGTVLGTLKSVGDTLSFAFYDAIHSSEGDVERYYSVTDCKVAQVAVRDDIRRVWDISATGGYVIYIASVVGLAAPVIFENERMTALQIPDGAALLYASLISEGDDPVVELLIRGYHVDVGVVDVYAKDWEGKRMRSQLEVDFVVNQGSQRYYIQVAYDMSSEEKQAQEFRSLRNIPDSFKKIVIVNGTRKPWRNDEGFVIMGMKYFLLHRESLEF